jgi:UDP-glucose 4-epimerase
MKKIVVLGGAGFLGSYICADLAKRGYQVVVGDIANTPYTQNFEFVAVDIMNPTTLEKIITPDVFAVYNLAGYANLDKAIHQPFQTFNLNVMGNLNVLNTCIQSNISHYVYASSAYAMNDKGSFYGISKLTSEKVIKEFHKRYGLTFTILRYGSVYSERAYENNYIYNLVKTALKTGTIQHLGDGEEIREYIHAADAAKLSTDMIEKDEYKNEIFILTGVQSMKRKDVFDMINEIAGGKISIELTKEGYEHHYKTTPYTFQPESSKKLVANPFIDMGQGILECMKAIENQDE